MVFPFMLMRTRAWLRWCFSSVEEEYNWDSGDPEAF